METYLELHQLLLDQARAEAGDHRRRRWALLAHQVYDLSPTPGSIVETLPASTPTPTPTNKEA